MRAQRPAVDHGNCRPAELDVPGLLSIRTRSLTGTSSSHPYANLVRQHDRIHRPDVEQVLHAYAESSWPTLACASLVQQDRWYRCAGDTRIWPSPPGRQSAWNRRATSGFASNTSCLASPPCVALVHDVVDHARRDRRQRLLAASFLGFLQIEEFKISLADRGGVPDHHRLLAERYDRGLRPHSREYAARVPT